MIEPQVFRLRRLDAPLREWDWPFARARAQEIDAHWRALKKAKPRLFNGRVLLRRVFEPPTPENGLNGYFFETDYSAFLAWRDFGFPDPNVCNCFAMAALRTADGAFVLGEMAPHTACAGQSYFPAGTPDRSDIRGDRVDLEGSLARELLEEAGVSLDETAPDDSWTIVAQGPRIACIKILNHPASGEALLNRLTRWLAQEKEQAKEPELACFHLVRAASDCARLRTPDFIQTFFAHIVNRPKA